MKKEFLFIVREFYKQAAQVTGTSIRFVKILFLSIIGFAIFCFAGLTGIYIYFAHDLPEINTIKDYTPPVISEVFANDGTRIGEFWEECRIFVPYDKIPKNVANAFVDAEDARFFEHRGVDVRSIIRAFFANLKAGSIQQGGSTITQQVTRALLLTREKKLARKVKEAILATRLERYLNKEEILTLYLNQIYLGNRAYGVAAAARNYFHKSLDELSIGQIALIAGLPTAPTDFSPINSPQDARAQQLHVLNRMVDQGHITKEEAKKAAAEEFEIFVAGIDKSFFNKDAAYFVEHVRRLVKEKYGDEILYRKGLKIYTTLDLNMQRAASSVIKTGIESLDRRLGFRGPIAKIPADQIESKAKELGTALLARQSGEVFYWPPDSAKAKGVREIQIDFGKKYEAIVVGFDGQDAVAKIGDKTFIIKQAGLKWARPFSGTWMAEENGSYVDDAKKALKLGDVVFIRLLDDGTYGLAQEPVLESALVAIDPHTGFVRSMIGGYNFDKSEFNRATQSLRQPGSSFKPFVYAAAFDKGYTLDTVVQDSPISFNVGGLEKVWAPKNYDGKFRGPISVKTALTFSRNIPTVRIAYDVGTHYITAYARKLGLTSPIDKYLSMALGANGVYLQDMVRSYATFANGGTSRPSVSIVKIENSNGEVVEEIPTPDFKKDESAPAVAEVAEPEKKNGAKKDKDEAKVDEEKASIGKNVKKFELNEELLDAAIKTIEGDKLVLTDLEIKTLYGNSIPTGHTITPQTAYIMTQVLKNVVEGGTGTRVKALGKPCAGKTGTTNDESDTWFMGFVPDLAAGIWVGYDEIKPIGKRVTGGTIVAPLFLKFMQQATDGWEAKDFPKPEGFPDGEVGKVAGGSTLHGTKPFIEFGPSGGADRAGEFFESEMEEGGYAPPSGGGDQQSSDEEETF